MQSSCCPVSWLCTPASEHAAACCGVSCFRGFLALSSALADAATTHVRSLLREQRSGGGGGGVDSPAVRARLLQLVGQQRDLLDGCQACQMLVDCEMRLVAD